MEIFLRQRDNFNWADKNSKICENHVAKLLLLLEDLINFIHRNRSFDPNFHSQLDFN